MIEEEVRIPHAYLNLMIGVAFGDIETLGFSREERSRAGIHIESKLYPPGTDFHGNGATHIEFKVIDIGGVGDNFFGFGRTKKQRSYEDRLHAELKNMFGENCPIEIDNSKQFKSGRLYGTRDTGEPIILRVKIDDIYKHIESGGPTTPFKEDFLDQIYERRLSRAVQASVDKDSGQESVPGDLWRSYQWQKLLSDNLDGAGVYFNTSDLAKLSSKKYTRKLYNPESAIGNEAQEILSNFEKFPKLAEATATAISDLGFRRMAFIGRGSSSLAFKTIPNNEERQQIILLTPEREGWIPNPLILPEIESRKIDFGGKEGMLIRVMPAVETGEGKVTDEHVVQVKDLIKKSGLEEFLGDLGPDIRRDNVGLYTYFDAGQKKSVTVPMVLDWGSVVLPKGANLEDLKRKWDEMPELEPWRRAQEAIKKQKASENVIDKDKAEKMEAGLTGKGGVYKKGESIGIYDDQGRLLGEKKFETDTPVIPRESRLMQMLMRDGFYPEEIKAAAGKAMERVDRKEISPDDFIKEVKANLGSSDKSQIYR